ncbi:MULTISPECIES: alpha-E domain-containing protein [Brucella/Ochrobactrum group]|uniref:Alpha-E domain-containing protein n=2 Tax=Ochrobactrum TaxID=528 RepID=A0A2P9HHD6_9HYPH|nr:MULTISPECIES: alpha-E domain-containing protein [Brucella]MCI1001022.1 alpha-E domain-containing protein [Ochrobactrum sp. C6C9]RRD22882.1 alpha-E domain-containing protein [Brucellaceae bacterium VT-16-1752]WHT44020.1 alpha-E domain-containing protein [Ochrobactrum sp. SSR]MDX4072693.1 alpha-E domain-containing protein [Brucella sp. NBRC 113783]NNU59443.1 alpha-E domain-containing protein [[Ochrobactrum] soli]
MLLGRTANGLFWMFRYIERAENMARLVDAGLRMALTKTSDAPEEWSSVVVSAGASQAFSARYDAYNAANVADFLLRDTSNPSSVMSCFETARSNARMVRTALTREAWESVNEAWMLLKKSLSKPLKESDLPPLLDQIKRETALIRGAFHGTMLRNEIFDFAGLGTFIERADNTARILDVKYYVLLPAISYVGTTLDNYQWESILRSVSAHRSYRWVYDGDYRPAHVADYLILNGRMPRSLNYCYRSINEHLDFLSKDYDSHATCHETGEKIFSTLQNQDISAIFDVGLHEFLTDFIKCNNRLGNEIAETYNFN